MSENKENCDPLRGEPPAPGREEETVGSKRTETLQLPPLPLRGRAGAESDNESVYSGSSNRSVDSLDDLLESNGRRNGLHSSHQSLHSIVSPDEEERKLEGTDSEKPDVESRLLPLVEVTLEDCQGIPPQPIHLLGQGPGVEAEEPVTASTTQLSVNDPNEGPQRLVGGIPVESFQPAPENEEQGLVQAFPAAAQLTYPVQVTPDKDGDATELIMSVSVCRCIQDGKECYCRDSFWKGVHVVTEEQHQLRLFVGGITMSKLQKRKSRSHEYLLDDGERWRPRAIRMPLNDDDGGIGGGGRISNSRSVDSHLDRLGLDPDLEAGLRGSQRSLHSLASQEHLEEERQQRPPHSDDLQYDILSCEDDHLAAPLQGEPEISEATPHTVNDPVELVLLGMKGECRTAWQGVVGEEGNFLLSFDGGLCRRVRYPLMCLRSQHQSGCVDHKDEMV